MNSKNKKNKLCSDSCCCSVTREKGKLTSIYSIPSPIDNKNKIPSVSPFLNFRDYLGILKVRLNIGRMNYRIEPGLYAVGAPDSNSPVLVSANYKMSFDYLRRELVNVNAWILVLDTKGINVWCAAGKGTFGTDELIRQIKNTNLKKIVTHNKLILPQLGAPGVAAHLIKEAAGFNVIYGPVRAADVPAFLQSGMRAAEDMRKVQFKTFDRLVLVPVEVLTALKFFIYPIAVFFILSGLSKTGYSVNLALTSGTAAATFLLLAIFSGMVIAPLLLPFIPGRAFALKGFFTGSVMFFLILNFSPGLSNSGTVNVTAWFFIISSVSSFLFMNYTGASTYTSLSGVKKEIRTALPLQITGFIIGFISLIVGKFI